MNLSVEGSKILVGSEWWQFEKPVLKAVTIQDKVLVIFDYMAFEGPAGQESRGLR